MLNNKVLIFDFDGVIVDSHQQRNDSFRYVLREFEPAQVDSFMKFHIENGGLSRFEKIKYFFDEIVKSPISHQRVLDYAYKVSDYVKNKITRNLVDTDILELIKTHVGEMHIVSASMDMELKWICRNLGIDKYFVTINGSQNLLTSKSKTVQSIIKIFEYDTNDVILIGDSKQDYIAAMDNDIHFLGYNFVNTEISVDHLVL